MTNHIQLLADTLNCDKDRLIAWFFVSSVISAQWFVEDNHNPTESLKLLSYLYPVVIEHYHKADVYCSYEKISDWYDEHRSKDLFEKPYLDRIISLIKPGSMTLDLGCGTGQPIAEYFIKKGFDVTGVDGSQAQIEKARKNLPRMTALCKDMRSLSLRKKFDCIIAWHSFFHLTKDDQRAMFSIFNQHIHPGGILMFTSGTKESEVWANNGGEMLYHASLSEQEYRKILLQYDFEVIDHTIEDPECGNATIWLAQNIMSF